MNIEIDGDDIVIYFRHKLRHLLGFEIDALAITGIVYPASSGYTPKRIPARDVYGGISYALIVLRCYFATSDPFATFLPFLGLRAEGIRISMVNRAE